MKNIKRAKWSAMIMSFVLIFAFSVQATFGYIVISTQPVINTFKPLQSIMNGLMISKTIEHPYGRDYIIPDNISFDFEVDLGSEYAGYTFNTSDGEKTADPNGMLAAAIKPGSTLTIEGIDAGTKVIVTEKQNKNGFVVKNNSSQEVTISENGTMPVDFVNSYSPEKVKPNITVSGEKILKGREWQEGDIFSFLLEYDRGNGEWENIGEKIITYDGERSNYNRFDFSEAVQALEFTNIGTYTFRMSEIKGSLDGMVYDETVNYFQIVVTDTEMDGKLEIGTVTGTQNANVVNDSVTVTFNNTFQTPDFPILPEDITVDIIVNKTIKNTGTAAITPEGFHFELLNIESGEKVTLCTDKDGVSVHSLTFTAEDIGKTVTYILTEVNDGRANVIYSKEKYEIKVTIILDESANKLITAFAIDGVEAEEMIVVFENTYDYSPENPLSPPTDNYDSLGFWFFIMLISGAIMIVMKNKRDPERIRKRFKSI